MFHLFRLKKWNAGTLAPLHVPGILVVENVLQMPWFPVNQKNYPGRIK